MQIALKNKVDECAAVWRSFAYFVSEYCHIEDKQSMSAIPFRLWPAQSRILSTFLQAPLLIILKARQLGLTWLCAAYALWICITRPLQLVVVISAKEDWAIEFLDRVKFIKSRLPEWMLPTVVQETGQILSFRHRGNLMSGIKSLATTVEGAQSKTPTLLIMDETARNRYAKSIYASSKPGIDKAGGRVIVISNSHKDGVGWPWTRGVYSGSMRGENDFQRIFMSWRDCPERPENFKEIQLSGGMDEDDFSQNYPESENEAISAMLGSYFGRVLERHVETIIPGVVGRLSVATNGDIEFFEDGDGILEVWRFPYELAQGWDGLEWVNRYCAGGDVSEGLGLSYSVLYVMDRHLGELVARLRSNRVDAYQWAEQINLLSRWYHNALLCIERTGAGQTTVKRLEELNANQYVEIVSGTIGQPMAKKLGWGETNQSKHELSGDLKQWFRAGGGFYCGQLMDEASSWIRHEGGKIGPEDGHLGDCVIAAGLAVQADQFCGEKPVQIEPEPAAWLQKIRGDGRDSAWAV